MYVNAKSSARISDNWPAARIRPSRGSVGAGDEYEVCFAGRCLMKKSICALHSVEGDSKSSNKSAMSEDSAAIPSTIFGSTAAACRGGPQQRNLTRRAHDTACASRAVAMCVHSRPGRCRRYQRNQATAADGVEANHWVATVVLP